MESYPPTPVTNYGIQLLKEGIEPHITYISPDGDIAFYLNGGLAPWPGVTEGVVLNDGIDGLHPIFTHLDHKGARQDGASWADTVYDPAEMTLNVTCTARTPENLRKIIRKWMAAWDPERAGTLSWVTPDGGEWWCHPRLHRAPPEKMERTYARSKQQSFTWSIRNDDAFWRSHDSVSQFSFAYRDGADSFNRDDEGDLGENWDQIYIGDPAAGGVCETEPALGIHGLGRAIWRPSGNLGRRVINRWLTPTASDNQVVTVRIGDYFTFPWPEDAYLDIYGRLSEDGQDGIRARIGLRSVSLIRRNGGVETVMRTRPLILPPLWWETWQLVCGTSANARHFMLLRSGFPALIWKETATDSALGSSYRYVGFGMEAGAGGSGQVVPPTVDHFSFGDNASITQSGHIQLTNFGDQPAFPDYVVYGPGTFVFANGPGGTPGIEFGPLKDGQVALIKTHPGLRAVYDLTADHGEQDLPVFQDFLKRLIALAFNNNVPPLMNWFQSLFGIQPEQGNLYSLLRGRFDKPVPPRPVAGPPQTSQIAVKIVNGNAESRVVAALTPLRRWPE